MDKHLYFATGYDGIDSTFTDADIKVILEALARVKVVNEHGLYRIEAPSAAEINVSPEVFAAMEQIAIRSNLRQQESLSNMSSIPRFRRSDELDSTPSDCVPRCAKSIARIFGLNGNTYYSRATSFMSANGYPDGVPSNQIGSLWAAVFGADHVTELDNRNPSGWFTNSTNTVTTLGIGTPSGGHQVIFHSMQGDSTVAYTDPQNTDRPLYLTPLDSVYNVHAITK